MPSATQLYQYDHVPETKENLDWADCKLQIQPYCSPTDDVTI